MMSWRSGFWVKLILTMYTRRSMPIILQPRARAVPHWPAPVSVVIRFVPAILL